MAGVAGTAAGETLDEDNGVTYDDDAIGGLEGDDTIVGLGGNDYIKGGAGADAIDGGFGDDTAAYLDDGWRHTGDGRG